MRKKEQKEQKSTARKIIKFLLILLFVAGIGTMGLNEYNAQSILSYGKKLERAGRSETALLAYQVVVKKYPLSFARIQVEEKMGRKFSPSLDDVKNGAFQFFKTGKKVVQKLIAN